MNWKSLLTDKRLGVKQTSDLSDHEGRSQFQKDFDRVVFSPAFRRLQDKTQVFPLPESDFVHTRLTHSLEVSVVGRSLGNLVGREILKRHPELKDEFTQFHFGEIVAAACLAHDIGNPPFGHSGEDAISEYFRKGNGRKYEAEIDNVKRWLDLTNYEGNAQGFRIITRLQNPDVKGGLRLTFATLAAFTKYPKESYSPEGMEMSAKQKVYKKFGFFQSEREIFAEIAEATELDCKRNKEDFWWCRHPLAFLVESADDICYRVMDLEDGFRLGLMSFKDTEELLIPLRKKDDLTGYKGRDEKEKIGYLRSRAIRDQVNELAETFLDQEKKVLDGNLEDDLITITESSKQLKLIKDVSIEKIYRTRSVVEREVAGYEVLGGLLDTFITAYNESYEKHLSPKNRAVINLLPARITSETNDDLYIRLLRVIDFVSGMTDSFAVSLFRKIKGISLPGRI